MLCEDRATGRTALGEGGGSGVMQLKGLGATPKARERQGRVSEGQGPAGVSGTVRESASVVQRPPERPDTV